MNDEYFNVEVGEVFRYEGVTYRKLDDRRAQVLLDGDGDIQSGEHTIHFYPEDEVQRREKANTDIAPPTHKQKLPAHPYIRNTLFLVVMFGLGVLLVGFLLMTIASLVGAR